MKSLILLPLLLCGPAVLAQEDKPPEADPVRAVTFRDALELGLAYNYGLKSARYRTLLQRFAVAAEDAAWDPVLAGSSSFARNRRPTSTELGGADVLDNENYNFVLGLSQPLRFGPTIGLEWRTDRAFTNSAFSTVNPAYDTALAVSLVVPLLQGRGRKVQEAALRRARAGLEADRHALEDDVAILVREIATAYWTLVALQSRLVVLEKSLEVATEIENSERRKASPDIGRSTVLDVTIARSETKRREAALIQGQRDAEDAADSLREIILPFTGEASDRIWLKAIQEPALRFPLPNLDSVVETAIRRRPDLLRIDAELAQLQENVVLAQDQVQVNLDLTADVTWRGLSDNFADSAEQTLKGDVPSARAMIELDWPLGQRAARAQLQRSLIELERKRLDRREKTNTIIAEARKAHRALRTANLEIETVVEEVRAATASLEGERKRLQRGSTTVLDVARLEENRVDAQLRLLEAQTTLEIARIALFRVSGTLLEEFNIVFGPDFGARRTEKFQRAPAAGGP